jgi:hypothetical protein
MRSLFLAIALLFATQAYATEAAPSPSSSMSKEEIEKYLESTRKERGVERSDQNAQPVAKAAEPETPAETTTTTVDVKAERDARRARCIKHCNKAFDISTVADERAAMVTKINHASCKADCNAK